jgi:acetyltransferase-like isoleucine patch superfamily enzyme
MSRRELRHSEFIRHKLFDERKSIVRKYADSVIGERSVLALAKFELITSLFGSIPGALGLFLRKISYPLLFKEIGKGVVFGHHTVLRHCDKIKIGDRVVVDDYALIDARGSGDEGVVIGDEVILGRGCYVQAKVGPIHIGRGSNIGSGTLITAQGGVHVGERVSIAGACKISGGLFEVLEDEDADPPFRRYSKGAIRIENRCVLAGASIILDGVTVGEGSLVGAGSVVSMSLPPYSICGARPPMLVSRAVVEQS